MDMDEIRYLLGSTIFARAKNYMKHIESFDCETEENGVRRRHCGTWHTYQTGLHLYRLVYRCRLHDPISGCTAVYKHQWHHALCRLGWL